MRLASFRNGRSQGFGIVDGDAIVDLSGDVATLDEALRTWGVDGLRVRAASGIRRSLDGLRWLPPVATGKILCVGLNYFEHAKEANMAVPGRPSIFVRFPSAQVGHDEPVVRPSVSTAFDYEAELAVVIGRSARHVDEADALAHVAGYACFAENSVRDWQKHATQATPGKNFDASGAFGPWIVTPDEAGDVADMDVVGRLNGTEMQRDSARNMIFSVPQMIAYVSTFTTLEPGDTIVTGTPAGVGFTRKPPVWLKDGDVFEVEISGVGLLRNRVVDEARGAIQEVVHG